MRSREIGTWLVVAFCLVAWAGVALAHITPPIVLLSDREAVLGIMTGAKRFYVREVRLTHEDLNLIQKKWRWRPEEEFYRFYLGRDRQGRIVATVIFLTEFTIHGPVRVAVGIEPSGRVKDAKVVELTEETYYWLKPLLDQDFTREYMGRDSRASFALSGRFAEANLQSMPYFYAQIVASLIQRGTILFEVTFLKKGGRV
ncbi:MAG: hypothetical protein ACE5I9_04705 [Candidatus Methylomirabilales bacterium]